MTWYAIRTAPQREIALEAMLHIKGYTVFLPTETKLRRLRHAAKKREVVTYPMFTGYLFIKAPFPWLSLRAERHVIGFVGFDGTAAPIADHEIAKLKNMSGTVPHRHSVNPHRALRTGELAEIQAGPFAGQVVKIEGLHGNKARIFINLFGMQKEATISIQDLEAA